MAFPHVHHPWRSRPAEYYKGGWDEFSGWHPGMWVKNGLQHQVGVHKKHYHLIWPKDGKNGGKWGRFKDVLSGKGPEIHATVSAQKMDYMHHRPRKPRWGLHEDLDDRGPDCHIRSPIPGVNVNEDADKCYDFLTRKYRHPYPGMWTDAHWQVKADKHILPKALRNNWGEWFQDPNYVPLPMHFQVFGDFWPPGGNAD